ncbi:sensor histidine kinase [Dactylosporangium sp. CS-033363]|uniref:sensor histidine kinase n=1 Tax=Dactylosporangium sp. CS-033363 TaxID=3239935 RepID=UPI003D8CD663
MSLATIRERLRTGAVTPPVLSRWAIAADVVLAAALTGGAFLGFAARVEGDRLIPGPPVPPPVPPGSAGPPGVVVPYFSALPWPQTLLWGTVVALATLPLAARRRYPLAVFWIVLLAVLAYHRSPGFGDPLFTFTACVVAAYSAVMHSPFRLPAGVSVLLGGIVLVLHRASLPLGQPALLLILILVPIGLAANAVHGMQQRMRLAEAQREADAAQAVQRERARIAQELHDVVTHNVSVMVVQAVAARRVLKVAPDKADEALFAIETGGRAAMNELRHVMGLLTMQDEPGPDALDAEPEVEPPSPGLDQIPELVARVRAAGTPVELTVGGDPRPLPAGIGLAVYRVVQEALTNAMKHAAGARVDVVVEQEAAAVRAEITDSGGTSGPSSPAGTGRGLVGLRERLAVYGGTLEHGPLDAGGYRVRAAIPLEVP